ncbi:RidA family protein [Azospira restricta]|uniref:RidA family protein n=1 Tax=Azospira restricta TaxID=404405 RepID=A0A974SNX8_9RHOO|nr:RidA family protein [Azospira restricta]QRJ63749.1 RidA family protein [Azospira restricta]
MTQDAVRERFRIPDRVPVPLGAYRAVIVRGELGFVSGQFPYREGVLAYRGKVGAGLSPEQGREAAALCALNALGQLRRALGADYARVLLTRVDGYIASAPDFLGQPGVLDGASELFVDVLGERGAHARTVFAVPQLPQDAPIELVVGFVLGDAA